MRARWLSWLPLLIVAACQPSPPKAPVDLPLSRYRPRAKLHSTHTQVDRLRFAAIDFHQHLALPGDRAFVPADRVVAMMDAHNVAAMVHLTGGGPRLQAVLDAFVKPHPGRFFVFTEFDWDRLRAPDFGLRLAEDLRRDVQRGARGLKLLKWFGLGARHADGGLVKIDDPRFDPVWQACAELRVPVAIHTGDPEAFFDPVDEHNERFEELSKHPDWSFHDPQFPRLPELLAARDRVIARHPSTTFVALHVGAWPENLDYVSRLLTQHPNVYVDLGARQAELGRQPRRARRFFIEHQDRILFGTDEAPAAWNGEGAAVYRSYGRFLETEDEAFAYYASPRQGRWTISGLALPEEVLHKVYVANARRVLEAHASLPAATPIP